MMKPRLAVQCAWCLLVCLCFQNLVHTHGHTHEGTRVGGARRMSTDCMESQPTKPPKLILGSSSAFRRKLWSEHFPAHTNSYCAPEIDEKAIRHTDAETLTLLIANAKADALVVSLLAQNPEMDALLVCMDQVVCCEGSIREKPETAAEARSFLASYSSGSAATCVNGIVVHNLRTGVRCATNELASVKFRPLPDSTIEAAIAQGGLFSSAGAFAIESPFFEPHIEAIDGSREAVIGLPVVSLRKLIAHASAAPAAMTIMTTGPSLTAAGISTIPSAMVPGFVVRIAQPADEEAAGALFACGMSETIESGLRRELRRADAIRIGVVVVAAAIAAAAALHLAQSPTLALGLAACVVTLALGLVGLAAQLVPGYVARGYIRKSMGSDMRSPCTHYLGRRGSACWVAVDDASGELVGMVALEPPAHGPTSPDETGWCWREGDAELRRMTVARWCRGRGVARALFTELRRFAEQHSYRRVVLSTSSMQGVAHDRLYPGLGFELEGRKRVLGELNIGYFALRLG